MYRRSLFLCLALLPCALPAQAIDINGTIQITTADFSRRGTYPLIGSAPVIISKNRALHNIFGSEWNDVRCSASAWEFAEYKKQPSTCPDPFKLRKMNHDQFRLPPLQTGADWRGINHNKTVPLQFLNDYDLDFSVIQFAVEVDGENAGETPPSGHSSEHPHAKLTIGDIKLFAGQTIPYGYLPADGRSVSKTDYPELYQAIGDRYTDQISEGQNSFDLPLLSSAVIYFDGNYKEITPIIRAKVDAHAPEYFIIGDIIISANPNRPLKAEASAHGGMDFSPLDEKKRTLPINSDAPLYALIGEKFGPVGEDGTFQLPRVTLKEEAADVDRVFFYMSLRGLFPSPG